MSKQLKKSVLYITYDGLLEPLGLSQVVAYLERLGSQGWPIHILSFEKSEDKSNISRMASMKARLTSAGIGWTPLTYHKLPTVAATSFDIICGLLAGILLAWRNDVGLIHVRSYVPALVGLTITRVIDAKFLFDMRGFWADERVDGGIWPENGILYRLVKKLESRFVKRADHIVVLTQASQNELMKWGSYQVHRPPVSVIPTCADLDLFSPKTNGPRESFVFGYVGSIGTWYLLEEIISFFLALKKRRPRARMLFINRKEHFEIRQAMERFQVSPDEFEIKATEHVDVPGEISRMNAAAAIIKPSYSKISSAPTKIGEYLGCGVPCVGNVNVGDVEEVLVGRRVGVVLRGFSDMDYERAVEDLLSLLEEPDIRDRCMKTARDIFSLENGTSSYNEIYCKLLMEAGNLSKRGSAE